MNARVRAVLQRFVQHDHTSGGWIAKLTVAAVASYLLADLLNTTPDPLLAPLTALLVVQLTMYETVAHGFDRIVSVVAGVLVAVVVATQLGLSWWSLGLVIAVSLYYDASRTVRGALIGSVAYFLVLFVTHLVYPAGMGFGDVKLALVMGLYLGWLGWESGYPVAGPVRLVLYALVIGCVLGVAFGLAMRIITKDRGGFAFGPALAIGCYVVVLFASDLGL